MQPLLLHMLLFDGAVVLSLSHSIIYCKKKNDKKRKVLPGEKGRGRSSSSSSMVSDVMLLKK